MIDAHTFVGFVTSLLHNLKVRSAWYAVSFLIDICESLNDAKWLTSSSYLWFIRRVHGTALRTMLKIVAVLWILLLKERGHTRFNPQGRPGLDRA